MNLVTNAWMYNNEIKLYNEKRAKELTKHKISLDLTDEEKKQMTDSEIEAHEQKQATELENHEADVKDKLKKLEKDQNERINKLTFGKELDAASSIV